MNDVSKITIETTPDEDLPDADPAKTVKTVDLNAPLKIVWDDSHMTTSLANVVNVLQTREEMTILFGTNQTWNAFETREINVKLSNRVVLTPHAAKRLNELLSNRIREYESRFGVLKL